VNPSQLRDWRKRLGLSQTGAADALGLSLRGYQNLEAGTRTIRKHVALACAAVALGLSEYCAEDRVRRKP
jgi:transcriptional regulator with XRE-family HTH domain